MLRLDLDEKNRWKRFIVLNSSLTLPKTILELPTKSYVDKKFNDRSIIKNTTHVDFNDKNFNDSRFLKTSSMPAVREHLTPKYDVDQVLFYQVNESSF